MSELLLETLNEHPKDFEVEIHFDVDASVGKMPRYGLRAAPKVTSLEFNIHYGSEYPGGRDPNIWQSKELVLSAPALQTLTINKRSSFGKAPAGLKFYREEQLPPIKSLTLVNYTPISDFEYEIQPHLPVYNLRILRLIS